MIRHRHTTRGLGNLALLWSAYNTQRFRGRPRVGQASLVDAAAVAADLPLSAEAVQSIMNSRKVTIEFDAEGRPVGAQVKIRGEERIVAVQ